MIDIIIGILWTLVKLGLILSFGLPFILVSIYYIFIIMAFVIQLFLAIPKEIILEFKKLIRRLRWEK